MPEASLHPIEASALHARRERVYLVLAGFFLGTLTMLNILGVTRFVDLSFTVFGWAVPMKVAVGVLPYPITFLCTDFISEFYGRRRANFLVLVGMLLNLWVVFVLWLGNAVPGVDNPDAIDAFAHIRTLTMGTVWASMIAYLSAQLCDVYLFHFWKNLTRGRHLWLRNNGSTLVSQLVDTTAVILITHFYSGALPLVPGESVAPQLAVYIASGYVFKFAAAVLDTIPFYLGAFWLARYLQIDPTREHDLDAGK